MPGGFPSEDEDADDDDDASAHGELRAGDNKGGSDALDDALQAIFRGLSLGGGGS
jgi:hypothetical protein